MATGSGSDAAWREQLSALADGEFDDPAPLCAAWSGAEVRATWHAYHLIGDVLRSEDLAAAPARDAALLQRVRERLAEEPVVLAPLVLAPAGGERNAAAGERSWPWRAAAVVAAGFVAVGGVYTLMRPADSTDVASTGPGPRALPARVAMAPALGPAASEAGTGFVVVNGNLRLIRDARLDAYLAAHKQFAGSSALGVPPAFLRSATLDTSAGGR
jgi:sigma-E factor negative regulatory protein RseA